MTQMKGTWVYDQQKDIWHLIWGVEASHLDSSGSVFYTVAWCSFRQPSEGEVTKEGNLINGIADALHDECVRKAETL